MEEGDTSIDSITSDTEQQTHCSPQRCVDTNNDQNVLWCLKCKRAVHFKCTNIPAYHIQAIINKSKHKRFTCINCIEVSAEILELTKKPEPVNQEIIQIKNDVKRTENIVKAQRETINKQNTEIIQLQRNANGNNILEVEKRLKGIITSKIDELQEQLLFKTEKDWLSSPNLQYLSRLSRLQKQKLIATLFHIISKYKTMSL